jgi:hypothetical protein
MPPDDSSATRAPLSEFIMEPLDRLVDTVGTATLPVAIIELMSRMVVGDKLWKVIESTRGQPVSSVGYVGGNAATILGRIDPNFSNRDLSAAVLNGALLHRVNLGNSALAGMSLEASWLEMVESKSKEVRSVIVSPHLILVKIGNRLEQLPRGAVVLDAIRRLHEDMLTDFEQVTVNGIVSHPMNPLEHGDMVWITKGKASYCPSYKWLHSVRTSRTKSSLRSHLRSLANRGEAILLSGRRFTSRTGKSVSRTELYNLLETLTQDGTSESVLDILVQVGFGALSADLVFDMIRKGKDVARP